MKIFNNGTILMDSLSVSGNIRVDGTTNFNPFWVAGRINGNNVTILQSKGTYTLTFSRSQTVYYHIGLSTPHPDGSNFILLSQGEGDGGATWNILHNANGSSLANTSTGVIFIVKDVNFSLTNRNINFAVLA
mgnify:CR=1 FL=1